MLKVKPITMYVCFYDKHRNINHNDNDIKAVKRKNEVYYLKLNCDKLKICIIYPKGATIKKKKE